MLTCYIDFKCPASYLAIAPTQALADEIGTKLSWKPFEIRPYELHDQTPDETKGETHRRVRAEQRRATHHLYAEHQEITLNFRDPSGGTQAALAALTCPLEYPLAYIEAAFAAYWQEGADLNDAGCVEALLTRTGNHSAIEAWRSAISHHASIQAASEDAGIFTTPTYLVTEHVFVGREHLPWIASLLKQAPGEPV